MSNDYPPPGSGQDPADRPDQSDQPPPPAGPQWNPQSAGTPPPSYGESEPPGYGQPGYGEQPGDQPGNSPGDQQGPPAYPPPPPGGYDQGNYGQGGYGQGNYGQGGYPPGGYGQGGYPPVGPGGYGQPQQTSPLAIVALVLGVVGICCAQVFVLSIGAIVTGFLARNQIKESPQLKGDGLALAGLILGGVGILVGIGYWILFATGVFSGSMDVQTY